MSERILSISPEADFDRFSVEIEEGGYSLAALMAVRSRLMRGYHTPYDGMLYGYMGDPRDHMSAPDITRTINDRTYTYNNVLTTSKSYASKGQHMVCTRFVQTPNYECITNENAQIFVVTADLDINTPETIPEPNKGRVIEWNVINIEQTHGDKVITLTADDWSSESNSSHEVHPTMLSTLSNVIRLRRASRLCAQLVLRPGKSTIFVPEKGAAQNLAQVTELVDQVNRLTNFLGIDLAVTARSYIARQDEQSESPQVSLAA